MKWLKSIFTSKREKELEELVKVLETKLRDRQEAINKTNAYWKNKMHEIQKRPSRNN